MQTRRKVSLSDDIVTSILEMIVRQEYVAGDKLPPEKQLMKIFGVSRLPLREALAKLQSMGVLSVKQGKGSFVEKVSPGHLTKRLTPLLMSQGSTAFVETMEVRKTIELRAIKLACARADSQDVESIRQCLKAMESCPSENTGEYLTWDFRFHENICIASRNRIFVSIFHSIADLIRESQLASTQLHRPEHKQVAVEQHRRILEALQTRDAKRAREALVENLNDAEQIVLAGMSENETSKISE